MPANGPAPPHIMPPQYGMPMNPNADPHLEYRLMEINRRLEAYHQCSKQYEFNPDQITQYWECFATEFFDNNAMLTISILENNEPHAIERRYAVSRIFIPRFFRSFFDNGVSQLSFNPLQFEDMFGVVDHGIILSALNVSSAEVIMKMEHPLKAEVRSPARLFLEFSPFDESGSGYRIRTWTMEVRMGRENVETPDDKLDAEGLRIKQNGLASSGLPISVLSFLKMCNVLEPMRLVMLYSKADNMAPREAFKRIVFQQFQRLNPPAQAANNGQGPEESPKKQPKKRQRKNANTANATGATGKRAKANAANAPIPPMPTNSGMPGQPFPMNQNFPQMPYPHEVMVVNEPSMMGTECCEDDERAISRVENAQYDQNAALVMGDGPPPPNLMPNHGLPPGNANVGPPQLVPHTVGS